MQKLKSFIFNRILGLILLAIFIFSSLSMFSRSLEDPYFGHFTSLNNIGNFFGIFGSYYAGTVLIFFGNSSYLIPIFFLIIGIKKIIGIEVRLLLIRFISFFISIILLNFCLSYFLIEDGLISNFLLKITIKNFEYLLNDTLVSFFVFAFLFLFSIFLLFYGLSIKIKNIFLFIIPVNKLLLFFLKILKFTNIINLLRSILSTSKKISKDKYENRKYINNKYRKEPTFNKNKIKLKNIEAERRGINSSLLNSSEYNLPPLSLLLSSNEKNIYSKEFEKRNENNARQIEDILKDYGVEGRIINFKTGPVITLFEFQPSPGTKTSKVIGLAADIARSMSSISARISSQPGKNSIGIEIPNEKRQNVYLGDLIKDEKFINSSKSLSLALGKNISGEKIYTDLEKMPHLLIAGTTGSGKSVGINSMILSLLYKFKPSECKLILIDPKMLELSVYQNIPHLLTPVVTDPKKSVFALKWVVSEMGNRYRLMSSAGVKNIKTFNEKIIKFSSSGKKLYKEVQTGFDTNTNIPIIEKQEIPLEFMPLIVVVIDEMADLMMVAGKEVEHLIQRLAQMARASGIHLIAATQRPSVDVITGTIKANFPSRISYRVASKFDSRTILNEMGAEQLLGSGDMLFLENGANLMRLHGGYVSEKEIDNVVKFINSQSTNEMQMDITKEKLFSKNTELNFNENSQNVDELYSQAISIVIEHQRASTSFIQRYLQIGYNRAARIIEQMEKEGVVSEANHVGKRSVLKKNI